MAKKPKYVPSISTSSEDVAAAKARNQNVARIGDTPLAVGGVMRDGKVEGLMPKAYNFRAPGKGFAYNMRANGGEAIKRERENTKAYTASLPKREALKRLTKQGREGNVFKNLPKKGGK